jgi:protease I
MSLETKTILLFAGPDFEDRELLYPYFRFLEAGAKVLVAGLGEKQYKGKCGVPIDTDGAYSDFTFQSFDALVIPGGWAPDKIRMDEDALTIVRKAVSEGKPVGAICHGGWVLCSADVLKGRTVTSYRAIRDDMVHAGARWVDEEVVVDGPLITSRTPYDLPAFSRALIKAIESPVSMMARESLGAFSMN